jgi:hypothetical protein
MIAETQVKQVLGGEKNETIVCGQPTETSGNEDSLARNVYLK